MFSKYNDTHLKVFQHHRYGLRVFDSLHRSQVQLHFLGYTLVIQLYFGKFLLGFLGYVQLIEKLRSYGGFPVFVDPFLRSGEG